MMSPTRMLCLRATAKLCFPVKNVQVLTNAKLTKIIQQPGTLVDAGSVVAELTSSNNDNNNKDGELIQVQSPNAGRIVDYKFSIGDTLQQNEDLYSIDTLLDDFYKQWQQSGVSPDFLQQNILISTDIPQLVRISQIISASKNPVQALSVLERILELQQLEVVDQFHTMEQTHTDIGILLYRLGDLEAALSHLQAGLDLRKKKLHENQDSESSTGIDKTSNDALQQQIAAAHIHIGAVLGQLAQSTITSSQSDKKSQDYFDQCDANFNDALTIQRHILGNEHALVAASLNSIGAINYQRGKYGKALEYYQKALDIQKKTLGEEHSDTAGTYNNIGIARKHLQDYTGALQACQQALQIRKAISNKKDSSSNNEPDVAASHYTLGQLLAEVGQLDASLEQYQAASKIQESIYGRQSPITASGYNNIGAVYYQLQKYEPALDYYTKAKDILSMTAATPDTASAWNNVGLALYHLQRLDESLTAHTTARSILSGIFGPDHVNLAVTIGCIGNIYKSQKRFDDAMAEYKTAHQMLESTLGQHHPDVAGSYNNMGIVLSQQGKLDDALTVYRAAQSSFANSLGSEHPHTASSHYNIGLVLQNLGKKEEAVVEYEKALDIWRRALGPDHAQTKMAEDSIERLS